MDFDTIESVRQFDKELRSVKGVGHLHINLEKAWKACQNHPSRNRLFSSVIDMQLYVACLNLEIVAIAQHVNADIRKKCDLDISSNVGKLEERLYLFEDTTNFVLRYRALWDKLMGVVVLLLDPKKYDQFVSSRSRSKSFVKLLSSRTHLASYAQEVSGTIKHFDERFRTVEAHGSGRMKKLVFGPMSADANPLEDLFWATNSLNDQLITFQKIFEYMAQQSR